MSLSVACTRCKHRTAVDPKFAGKVIQCPTCGQEFLVTLLDEPTESRRESTATEMAGALCATDQSGAPTPTPAKTTSPASKFGRVCPSCTRRVARGAKMCIACGYHLDTHKRVRTRVFFGMSLDVPRVRINADGFDHRGYRMNTGYDHTLLNALDTYVPQFCKLLFWLNTALVFGAILISVIRASVVNADSVPAWAILLIVLSIPAAVLLMLYAVVPFFVFGTQVASKILKFELPEDPGWRVIASWMLSLTITAIGTWFIFGWPIGHGPFGPALVTGEAAAPLAVLLCTTLLALNFGMVQFFLRLNFTEALLSWAMQAACLIITAAVAVLLAFLISSLWGMSTAHTTLVTLPFLLP